MKGNKMTENENKAAADENENKEEATAEQATEEKKKPWRSITCPVCKKKGFGNQYLSNKALQYNVCQECGVMFMNPTTVKVLLKKINSPDQKGCLLYTSPSPRD